MTNRIVLDTNGIKVSKPGINVLTATNPLDFLILSTNTSLGGLQTGILNTPQTTSYAASRYSINNGNDFVYYARDNHSFVLSNNVPLNNNTSNIPLTLIQRLDGASAAVGGGLYKRFLFEGHIEYTTISTIFGPRTIVTDYVYISQLLPESIKGINGYALLENNNATIISYDVANDDYRYSAFYTPLGATSGGGGGSTVPVQPLGIPDLITADTFGSTTSRVIDTDVPQSATLRFTFNQILNEEHRISITVNTTTFEASTGAMTFDVIVNDGDSIYCTLQDYGGTIFYPNSNPTPDLTYSFTVTNLSDNNTVVDNFFITVNAGYVPPSDIWTPVQNNNYTETDTQVLPSVSGSSRTLSLDNALSGSEYVMAFVNNTPFGPFRSTSSVNFTASTGDSVRFGFYTSDSYNTGGNVTGVGDVANITMSNSNLVPSNIISYNDLIANSDSSFTAAQSNFQSFNSISGTKTFKVVVAGTGDAPSISSSGGATTGILNAANGSFTFTADSADNVQLIALLSGTLASYGGTAKLYVVVNGYDAYLDTLNISLSTGSEGGFDPGFD